MRNEKGRFTNEKRTKEFILKTSAGIKKQWINRPSYHGKIGTKIHNSWRSMITRCNGTAGKDSIKKYKDKGTSVCERWKDFKLFYEDMNEGFVDGLTIDRIDNSKGYYKENCRWATYTQQANNKTNNKRFLIKGENVTIREISIKYKLNFVNLRNTFYRKCKKDSEMFIKIIDGYLS